MKTNKLPTYMLSVKPQDTAKILSGDKTIIIKKLAPKPPFKAVVYETINGGGRGKVVCEFICDKVEQIKNDYGFCSNDLEYWVR